MISATDKSSLESMLSSSEHQSSAEIFNSNFTHRSLPSWQKLKQRNEEFYRSLPVFDMFPLSNG